MLRRLPQHLVGQIVDDEAVGAAERGDELVVRGLRLDGQRDELQARGPALGAPLQASISSGASATPTAWLKTRQFPRCEAQVGGAELG